MIPLAAGCKQGMRRRMCWRVPRRFNAQQLCQSIASAAAALHGRRASVLPDARLPLSLCFSVFHVYIRPLPASYNTCSLERFTKNKRNAHLNTLLEFRLYGKPHTREARNNMHASRLCGTWPQPCVSGKGAFGSLPSA